MTAGSPYEAALGGAFPTLAPEVQRAHRAPLVAAGALDVEHGSHWLTPVLVKLLKLPAGGCGQRTRLEVASEGDELVWTRQIGAVTLRTRQRASTSHMVERIGPGRIAFQLTVDDGALLCRQVSLSVAGIPVPPLVAPQVTARVSAAGPEGWNVAVVVVWRGHLVCRYAGEMSVA